MKEIFIIYNKVTGFLDGGAGFIDRDWSAANADGSTILERIPEILAKNPDREVIYLPNQVLPDFDNYKIQDEEIVLKTIKDKLPTEVEVNEEKIQAKMRELAIESLKTSGDLPVDYIRKV